MTSVRPLSDRAEAIAAAAIAAIAVDVVVPAEAAVALVVADESTAAR